MSGPAIGGTASSRFSESAEAVQRLTDDLLGTYLSARKQGREYLIDPIQPTQDSIVTLSCKKCSWPAK